MYHEKLFSIIIHSIIKILYGHIHKLYVWYETCAKW